MTARTDHASQGIPITTLLWRAMTAEWLRLRSVRSTWLALLAALALAVMMGATYGYDAAGDHAPIWRAGEYTIVPSHLAVLVVVMLAVTSEYATGAIRTTLLGVPRRGVLLVARTLVAVATATVGGVLVAVVADVTAWLWLGPDAVVVASDIATSLAGIAVVMANGALITVGLGMLLRSTAGTLTSVFLLLVALPFMLPEWGVGWLTTVAEHLPGMALALLDSLESTPPDRTRLAAILVTWVAVITGAGAWSLFRRDAV